MNTIWSAIFFSPVYFILLKENKRTHPKLPIKKRLKSKRAAVRKVAKKVYPVRNLDL